MQDGGKRVDCGTGAMREPESGKGRFDLIPPEPMFRLARWYEQGAVKYGDRNWEQGLPVSRCVSAAFRHLCKYLAGWTDEDHLAAVLWNIMAIMWFEECRPSMQDLPSRKEVGHERAAAASESYATEGYAQKANQSSQDVSEQS